MGKNLDGKELGNGIIQKKNGRYEARYVNRFGKRVSISGSDLKDVKRRYNEAIYENEKEINLRGNIKLDDWYLKWMNIYKFDVIRENSKVYYNNVYKKHISPKLGNFYIKDITQLQIKELIKNLDYQGYKYETKNKVRIILLDMFNKAIDNEFVNRNPAKGITVKRNEEKNMQVLSVEDQISFFDCCKGTFYDNFFIVAISTGMRIGEIAALRKEDIDFENKLIYVKRTLIYQKYEGDTCKSFHFELPKTKTSVRQIPINRQCEVALKKQFLQKNVIKNKKPKRCDIQFQDLLFTTKYNTPLNAQIICDAIKKIVDEVNLIRDETEEMETFSCHCFRHTFATRCFEAGIQPKTVQSYLGHATLQMTMDLYTSVLQEYKMSEMNKLDNIFTQISESGDDICDKKYDSLMTQNHNNIINIGDIMVV